MYTVQIDMTDEWDALGLHQAIVRAIRRTPANVRGVIDSAVSSTSTYRLVVFDPYHRNAHPQMIKLSDYVED